MTAGMVAVPTIMPLKAPGGGTRKNMIDTETLIALHCSTKDSVMFYTLNSTKPDPFKRTGDKTTYQYLRPFQLTAGKHTIKAVAVLRDGSKESSVNTKVFQVNFAVSHEENEGPVTEFLADTEKVKGAHNLFTESGRDPLFKKVIRDKSTSPHKSSKSSDVVQKVLGAEDHQPEPIYDFYSKGGPSQLSQGYPPQSLVSTKRIAHVDSFDADATCFKCNAARPKDPYARFCNSCGTSLPPAPGKYRVPSVTPLSDVKCPDCGAAVPMNTRFCIICEKQIPTTPGKRAKAYIKTICENCGSANSPDMTVCFVCNEHLDSEAGPKTDTNREAPSEPPDGEFILCFNCKRINSGDARFCDWCGKRPLPAEATTHCQICNAVNNCYSKFCCSCGKVLHAPPRHQFLKASSSLIPSEELKVFVSLLDGRSDWLVLPTKASHARGRIKHASTQTSGLYYSSNTPLENGANKKMASLSLSESTKDRVSPISAVSPGKGFWRQQVDHVNHQLKVYAQNNIDFRDTVAYLRIGKLLAAAAEEGSDENELTITASFTLKNGKQNVAIDSKKRAQPVAKTVSSFKSSQLPLSRKLSSDSAGSKGKRVRRKKKVSKANSKTAPGLPTKKLKLSTASRKLLELLKSDVAIDIEVAEELFVDGADATAKDENDLPFLKLAVLAKHFNIIPLLIEQGSDINELSGVRRTSALHEAVSLGSAGSKAVEVLLENDASPDVKNIKGESPYDLAMASGIDAVTSKFVDKTSKDLLKEVMKI